MLEFRQVDGLTVDDSCPAQPVLLDEIDYTSKDSEAVALTDPLIIGPADTPFERGEEDTALSPATPKPGDHPTAVCRRARVVVPLRRRGLGSSHKSLTSFLWSERFAAIHPRPVST
ncbi:hypothetical protein ACFWU3_32730 [Streptomyces sp. NPDC058685]|uniref:hypothetical protein n=1 Tax=Streptomyces sp. NPDC058685 TaxID=3346598 RepID=UPI003656B8EE